MNDLLVFDDVKQPLKVISGMQTGVDQAALFAAELVGIQTGGYGTKNFRTHGGKRPDLARRFNIIETEIYEYTHRTEMNVIHSDATLQIAFDMDSPGERLTSRLIRKHKKPSFSIQINLLNGGYNVGTSALTYLNEFLTVYKIRTLNVAGNSERTVPNITAFAQSLLIMTFDKWKIENA